MTSVTCENPAPVLIVEDEALIRMALALDLEAAGFSVCEAGTAVEALNLLQKGLPVSVIVTDLRMPGDVDGRGLVAWIRQHCPRVPVIVASGYPPDHADGERLDASAFVSKPYDAADLIPLLHSLTAVSP